MRSIYICDSDLCCRLLPWLSSPPATEALFDMRRVPQPSQIVQPCAEWFRAEQLKSNGRSIARQLVALDLRSERPEPFGLQPWSCSRGGSADLEQRRWFRRRRGHEVRRVRKPQPAAPVARIGDAVALHSFGVLAPGGSGGGRLCVRAREWLSGAAALETQP